MGEKIAAFVVGGMMSLLPPTEAASTLISYAPTSAPTTQGWGISTTSSHLTSGLYQDGDRTVWSMTDPGNATGGGKTAHQYFYYNVSANQHQQMFSQGWRLKGVMNLLDEDPNDRVALSADRNSWMAYIYNLPGGTARNMFGISIGRHSDGRIQVSTYQGGSSIYLDPGYHEYEIRYDAMAEQGAVYIDGVFWKDYQETNLASAGQNRVYWGDNYNQTSSMVGRTTLFGDLSLNLVPEPSKGLLFLLGSMALCLRRRR